MLAEPSGAICCTQRREATGQRGVLWSRSGQSPGRPAWTRLRLGRSNAQTHRNRKGTAGVFPLGVKGVAPLRAGFGGRGRPPAGVPGPGGPGRKAARQCKNKPPRQVQKKSPPIRASASLKSQPGGPRADARYRAPPEPRPSAAQEQIHSSDKTKGPGQLPEASFLRTLLRAT